MKRRNALLTTNALVSAVLEFGAQRSPSGGSLPEVEPSPPLAT